MNKYFSYLYTLERVGIKYSLRNIRALLKAMGNPHTRFKSIHIAGTNGKGATASFAASILQEQGLKTGLFTSPHLLKFNERIRVNGKCIPDSYIKAFLTKYIKLIEKIKPSFFEVNTAMAFKYFADNKVDCAVVECGLGGRLDSTNVLKPLVSVITQIGLDHKDFLGSTLNAIAAEKAAILKRGSEVIISDTNRSLRSLFRKKVTWQDKIFVDEFVKLENIKTVNGSTSYEMRFKPLGDSIKLTIPLPGVYQARNAACALLAALSYSERTNIELDLDKVMLGLKNLKKNTGYRGRLETVKKNGLEYVFDVSHNPQGIANALAELKPTGNDVILMGIMADKDHKSAVKEVLKYKSKIVFTKPSYQRALEPDILLTTAVKLAGNSKRIKSYSDIHTAIANAEDMLENKKGRMIFIGSFFLIHDAIKTLKFEKIFT